MLYLQLKTFSSWTLNIFCGISPLGCKSTTISNISKYELIPRPSFPHPTCSSSRTPRLHEWLCQITSLGAILDSSLSFISLQEMRNHSMVSNKFNPVCVTEGSFGCLFVGMQKNKKAATGTSRGLLQDRRLDIMEAAYPRAYVWSRLLHSNPSSVGY